MQEYPSRNKETSVSVLLTNKRKILHQTPITFKQRN